jgi:hypothetical protein
VEFATRTIVEELEPGVTTVIAQEGQPIDAAYRHLIPADAITDQDPRDPAVDYGPTHAQNHGQDLAPDKGATGGAKRARRGRNKAESAPDGDKAESAPEGGDKAEEPAENPDQAQA